MSSIPTTLVSSAPTTVTGSTAPSLAVRLAVRIGIGATLIVSGVVHAYLYIHGYQYIPTIGTAFLLQASVFCALGVLVLVGGPDWLSWGGAALSVAAVIAFALSRTVGLLGFTEHGWEPPYGPVSVIAQMVTVVLVAAAVLASRRAASRATRVAPAVRPPNHRRG
jgi:hypothetical protein